MSKKPDKNLISFSGDKDGNIWRNNLKLFTTETPKSERVWIERFITIPEGEKIADALKFSGVRDFTLIVHGDVPGGYEDCIDINNECYNLSIHVYDGYLLPTGKYAITLKGGSKNIWINAYVKFHPKIVVVDLGNHSDQSKNRTENVELNVLMKDESKTTYRRINATEPKLQPNKNKYKRKFRIRGGFRQAFVWIYAKLKKLGVPI